MIVKKMVQPAVFVTIVLLAALLPSGAGYCAERFCPAYPAPSGTTVTADSEQSIWDAVNSALPGTTILIADGTYNLASRGYYLWIDTPGITLRSASGDRSSVILDDNYSGTEIITVAASDVTIADLTIRRAGTHPIHVVSTDGGDTRNALIYNVHIIDPGQQAIKINPHGGRQYFTDYGEVACSTIELTDAGRDRVWQINGSCYTGGVDAHQSRGWVIRDNTISGFWCQQGLSEHGIHLWTGSRDTVVERNTLMDNARGIGFGLIENGSGRTYADNPCPGANGHVGHFGGTIRNNVIWASSGGLFASQSGADGGIALAQSCGTMVVHNTIAFTRQPFAAIEWRFSNTDADVINNLTTHNLRDRGGAANLSGNLENQPLSLFVNDQHPDLHLNSGATAAIDQGVAVPPGVCDDDYDGQLRPDNASRDIGADEWVIATGNTLPVASNQQITVEENSMDNSITLGAFDIDGDPLTYTITTMPANGSIGGTAPDLTYTPATDFSGTDTLRFSVNDGQGDSNLATITITVESLTTTSNSANTSDSSDSSTVGGGGSGGGCFIQTVER